jgi:hypothetical protein
VDGGQVTLVTETPDDRAAPDLITSEGVDEGSADSTVEGRRTPGDVGGPPTRGRPGREEDPAGPQDLQTPDIAEAERRQPGQELAEGEG